MIICLFIMYMYNTQENMSTISSNFYDADEKNDRLDKLWI